MVGPLGIAGLASLAGDLAEKRMKEPSAIPRYPHIGFSVAVHDDLAAVTKRAPSRLGRRAVGFAFGLSQWDFDRWGVSNSTADSIITIGGDHHVHQL